MAERTIKVAWFRYREQLVVDGEKAVDANGDPVYVEKTARKDETVDIPLRADLDRGEQHGLFTSSTAEPSSPLAEMSDVDLAIWVADSKVADIVDAVGDDATVAERVLDAENAATEQRSSLVKKLETVAGVAGEDE